MDEAEFSRLYEIYLPKIFGFVARRINNREEAEDLVSNIFLKVVENIKNFNPAKSSFKTWIYTIATNMMIDYFRTVARKKTCCIENAESMADQTQNPAEGALNAEQREKVFSAIRSLPERHQKVLLLRYCSDLSIVETAEALNVTENNVSVIIHRALKAFEITYKRYV
ncbi:sigma-70 family RNA polymerase sigma factor [Candidatus Peregrinibacteria bacterium]|nr:sigma-70 family RNA polymerase sigma factor [Candidatus Peregrinibacteria bacterium]